ncbi:MAG: alkaline phosphatase family protein [Candidatus Omnitrophota bacterium]
MKKIIYVVLDGLGDRPCKEFDGKTPLEAAEKPNMNSLLKKAKTGVVYTVGKGIAPESDVAVISILGYDAHKYYTGRGPLESYAEGLEVNDGDLAFRVNFATIGENNEIIDRRVGRNLTTEEATQLAKEINEKVKLTSYPVTFKFKNTIGHRGILVIYRKDGKKLKAEITNTDPAYDKHGVFGVAKAKFENFVLDSKPTADFENDEETIAAAKLINEFTKKSIEVLNASEINKKRISEGKLPGNLILSRDAGDKLPKFPPIYKEYGIKFGCFVEMPVEKGIAILTGMDIVKLPLPTGNLKDDYTLRAKKVFDVINNYDGLYIHIKGPDEPAHDGNALKKKESIEAIDKFFFSELLRQVDLEKNIITITSDHSTPCTLKAHSDDPVPLLIASEGVISDGTADFSEKFCVKGNLGELEGKDLMPLFIKFAK